MNSQVVAETRRLFKQRGPGSLKESFVEARRNSWRPHQSRGIHTKYGGPCVSKVNWNAF